VLFIMFQAGDVAKSTPLSAARTLTYQLLDGLNPNDAALVEAVAQRSSRSGSSEARDFRSLWELFCENVCKLQTAIIVVDAIDECQDGPVFIDSILKLSKAPHIKILITGRREANLLSHLESHQSLNFGVRENHQDIFYFLSTEISNSRKLSDPVLSKHFLERFNMSLCDYLLQRANGLFIWASLVLKELDSQITVEDILRTVDELPQELVDIYNLILRNIPVPERKLCTSILRWLACAVRPLSVAELWEVLSIEMAGGYEDFLVSEREIEISCGSLVVMENGFMHLVHHSLAEFLCNPSREPQSSSPPVGFTIDVSNANLTMLASCLTYIDASVTDLNVEPKTQRERPCSDYLKGCYSFLEYAVYNWAHHLQNIETLGDANIDSRILWGDRWLYWIEFWFALGAQDLWSLERYVEALSNRCQSWDSVGPNGRASLKSTFNWTQHAARLLELYGQALQEDPSSIHFIDTDLGGQRLSTTASCKAGSASTPSPRTRNIRLRSTSFSEELLGGRLNESLSRSRLELPRYGHRLLGLFYADVSRGVIFMASYETVVPELLCQDMQTGRTMRPMRQGRTSITGTRYSYEGFSISKGGKYIATLHRSYLDETYYPRHRYQLTVWDISERLALCGSQQDEWCSIAVSMSFESRFLGQCSQPLAFDDEDTLYCLSGRIDIRSAILGNSTFDESILQRSDFGKLQDLRGLGYSADCQSLVVYHGLNKWLARLNINDMSRISLKTFSALNAMVYSISYRGRYVVWQDTMASRHYCVHDFSTQLSRSLPGSHQIAFPANLNLVFSRDEECLLGIMASSPASGTSYFYVAIWRSISSDMYQVCSPGIPAIVGISFSTLREPAYLATKDRWLEFDPLDLDSLKVENEQQGAKGSSVISQVSSDGTSLILLSRISDTL